MNFSDGISTSAPPHGPVVGRASRLSSICVHQKKDRRDALSCEVHGRNARERATWLRHVATIRFLAIALLFASFVRADEVRIATMRLGTSWYVFGATLYKLLKDNLPAGTRVEVIAKGGGVGNPVLVNSGKASIALANVASAAWARDGDAIAYEGKKHENIRALVGGLNSVWYIVLAREEFVARTGQDTLEKILLGKEPVRIIMKPRGSTIPVIADMIFDALGTSRARIAANGGQVLQVDPQQIPDLFRDGRADVYFEAAPLGHPTVTEVTLTSQVRFLELPESVIHKLTRHGLRPSALPKFFKGQTAPTPSVDLGTVLLAHKALSDELAYLITKTICENKTVMGKGHKAWAKFQPEVAGQPENTGILLHPGARRYYEEKGWLQAQR